MRENNWIFCVSGSMFFPHTICFQYQDECDRESMFRSSVSFDILILRSSRTQPDPLQLSSINISAIETFSVCLNFTPQKWLRTSSPFSTTAYLSTSLSSMFLRKAGETVVQILYHENNNTITKYFIQ